MKETEILKKEIDELKSKIQDLNFRLDSHAHTGNNDQRLSINDFVDLISVVSSVPSHTPRDFSEQFAIYISGGTYRFYWHDGSGWRYATGT